MPGSDDPGLASTAHPGHEHATADWLLGADPQGEHRYIVHVAHPAFLAKVADAETEGVLSGLSYGTGTGGTIYDFLWFDEFPGDEAFRALMRLAEEVLAHAPRPRGAPPSG